MSGVISFDSYSLVTHLLPVCSKSETSIRRTHSAITYYDLRFDEELGSEIIMHGDRYGKGKYNVINMIYLYQSQTIIYSGTSITLDQQTSSLN